MIIFATYKTSTGSSYMVLYDPSEDSFVSGNDGAHINNLSLLEGITDIKKWAEENKYSLNLFNYV